MRQDGEPSESGWDAADTVTSFPEPDAFPEPAQLPPRAGDASPPSVTKPYVVPSTVAAPGAPPASVTAPFVPAPTQASATIAARGASAALAASAPSPKPAAGQPAAQPPAGLGAAMREEVWSIVRAAVDEAVRPLVARQRELEARLEKAERERANAPAAPPAQPQRVVTQASPQQQVQTSSAAAKLASIPVALGSIAPPAVSAAAPPTPRTDPSSGAASTTIPDIRLSLPPSTAVRGSVPPQGYGVVVMTAPRPTLDLESVGHVDIAGFDGGRRKRTVARVVIVLMLLVIVGVITMTLLSYNT